MDAGAASLIIWTITALALIKYGIFVLRADDNGQGASWQIHPCSIVTLPPCRSSHWSPQPWTTRPAGQHLLCTCATG